MTYCTNGFTYRDVEELPAPERRWYIDRLHKQMKRESEEYKRQAKT